MYQPRHGQGSAYAIDHNGGSTAGIEPKVLNEYEKTIQIAAGNNAAYLLEAKEIESGEGYELTAKAIEPTQGGLAVSPSARQRDRDQNRTCTP